MKLKFWGVRGSIPTPISNFEFELKIKNILKLFLEKEVNDKKNIDIFYKQLPFHLGHNYGGNSPCLSVEDEDLLIILDCGSGIKDLSSYIMSKRKDIKEFYVILTHLHWDHIIGLPFFVPIFLPDKIFHFYNDKEYYPESIKGLFKAPHFPVDYSVIEKKINYNFVKENKSLYLGNLKIDFLNTNHPGGCINIKITNKSGKSIVYATDSEYQNLESDALSKHINFFMGSEVLIFDSQYTLADAYLSKLDWGHSSSLVGIDISIEAKVKKLVLFHHDPYYNDEKINSILENSIKYKNVQKVDSLEIEIGYEGLEIVI